MKSLKIGDLEIPINGATKTFAILAKRGAGKTYTGAVFAEEFAKNNIPFVVFDPIDVWWGLRLKADGKGKGLPIVVFGLEHADIKIDRDMGRIIAQAVVRKNISCVISTFGMPKTAQRHLIAEFADELLNINDTPRHLFIEEAHEFVPQRVMGDMGKTFNAVSNLVVMGRNRGIGVTLINQRASTINKDVLTQIDTLLAFRNVSPQDRKALKEWTEYHDADGDFDKFYASLPSLPTGEGWIWSPEFMGIFKRFKVRKRETFHPDREKLGNNFVMPKLDSQDIDSFISEFSGALKSAEEAKKTTKKDGKQVVKKDFFASPAPIEKSMIEEGWVSPQEVIRMKNDYETQLIEKDTIIRTVTDIINRVRSVVGSGEVSISGGVPIMPVSMKNSIVENLPQYDKDIMRAIMEHPNIPFSRVQLALKSGKSAKSSQYDASIARLIKLDLLKRSGRELVYQL
jgi:hypothetical protein